MKMKNKSQYSSMYLVPQDIYKRLLDSADSREKIKIGDLNKFDVGNESGAFPDTPLTPDQDGYDDDDNNDDGNNNDGNGRYNLPPQNRYSTSTSTSSSQSRRNTNSSTDTSSETEQFLLNNPTSNHRAFQLDSDSDDVFSSSFNTLKNIQPRPHQQQGNRFLGPELERVMNDMSNIRQKELQRRNVLYDINTKKKIERLGSGSQDPNSSSNKSYLCNICSMSFPGINLLVKHKKDFHFSKRSISTDANTNIQIQGIPLRPKTNENQNQNTPETNSQSQLQTVLEPESEIMDMDIDIDKTVDESRKHQHQNQNLCNKCGIVFSTDKLLIRHAKDFHSPKRNVIERKKLLKEKKKNVLKNWKNTMSENKSKSVVVKKKNSINKKVSIPAPATNTQTQDASVTSSSNYIPINDVNADNFKTTTSPIINNISSSVIACKLCPASFNSQKSHDRHLGNIHNVDNNYKSKDNHGVKRKIGNTNGNIIEKGSTRKKQAVYLHKCKLCSNSYKEKKVLDRHLKNVHNSDNNYIYQLPQGTKRKNVYTNDKDKNNIKKIRKNEVYMKWK